MAWLSRNDLTPTTKMHSDNLNNLANDVRVWGGNVNGGGYVLSNVVLQGVAVPGGLPDPTTTLGDLIVRGSTAPPTRLGVGSTDGQVLTVDHLSPLGMKWAAPTGGSGGGAVASVFGRTGAVVAQSGDYLVSQIAGAVPNSLMIIAGAGMTGGGSLSGNVTLNAMVTSVFGRSGAVVLTSADIAGAGGVPSTRQVLAGSGLTGGGSLSADVTLSANVTSVMGRTGAVVLTSADLTGAGAVLNTRQILAGTGLTGGGNLTIDRSLSVVPDSTLQKVQAMKATVLAGARCTLNFVDTSSATWNIADNTTSNRIDISLVATGSGSSGLADPTTTLGDLLVRGPSAVQRFGIGTDGQVLTADHLQPLGVRWSTPAAAAPVTSVFSRTGAVVAAGGDYTAAQITNAVDITQVYVNPAWISSLAWSKISGAPATGVSTVFGRAGAVVAAGGDYSASQITNAVDVTVGYANPAWITSLAWSKITGAPSTGVSSVFGRTGAVAAAAGDYTAAMVTNAVSTLGSYADPGWITSLAWGKITGAPSTGVASVFGRSGAVAAATGDYTAAQITNAVSTAGSYADPAWLTSLSWAKITGAPAAPVSSVFGRGGAVVATAGDYTAAKVTNAVDATQAYANPAWISSLAWSKITGAPSVSGPGPWTAYSPSFGDDMGYTQNVQAYNIYANYCVYGTVLFIQISASMNLFNNLGITVTLPISVWFVSPYGYQTIDAVVSGISGNPDVVAYAYVSDTKIGVMFQLQNGVAATGAQVRIGGCIRIS